MNPESPARHLEPEPPSEEFKFTLPPSFIFEPNIVPSENLVVSALQKADMTLAGLTGIRAGPGSNTLATDNSIRIEADLAASEDAVLLLEQKGVFSWKYPKTHRCFLIREWRRRASPKRVTFDIPVADLAWSSPNWTKGQSVVGQDLGTIGIYIYKFNVPK